MDESRKDSKQQQQQQQKQQNNDNSPKQEPAAAPGKNKKRRSLSQPTHLFARQASKHRLFRALSVNRLTEIQEETTNNSPLRGASLSSRLDIIVSNGGGGGGGAVKANTRRGLAEVLEDHRYYQELTKSLEQASAERKLEYMARTSSIRQNARLMTAWMLLFLTLSITFFVHYGGLTLPNAMLFAVYSLTTAGFGSVKIPFTTPFLIAVVVFIFVGLASVTILAATLYQWTAWRAYMAKQHKSASRKTLIGRIKKIYRSSELGRGLIVAAYLLAILWFGTIVMTFLENWNVMEAFYFATYVMTTVGYGSPVAPVTVAGTWFCVFWVPFNISFLSIYMGNLGRYYYMLTGWNARRIQRKLRKDSMLLSESEVVLTDAVAKATAATTTTTTTSTTAPAQMPEPGGNAPKTLDSMKDILDFVLTHVSVDDSETPTLPPSANFKNLTASQQKALAQWLQLPSPWGNSVFAANQSRKPSLPLILLVQERMAHIIATEIAGHVSPCTVKSESTLSVTLESMDKVLDKWLIPAGPVEEAFRVVALEALVVVGEHRLVTQGADAVFALGPFQVMEIFLPILAAMADAGTMEGWLARTEKQAGIYFPRASQV